MDVLWFVPTHGDGRYLGTPHGARSVDLPYMQQIARAADSLGFAGVLLPTGRSCEDAWVVAAALTPLTERLRFLVAVRPGIVAPTTAARMTATLDRLSGGRVLLNIVTGGDPGESEGDGVFLDHDGRYAAATVRGTTWLTEDRCDGTLIVVKRGVVTVLDKVRHKTITVTAGHTYLVRA